MAGKSKKVRVKKEKPKSEIAEAQPWDALRRDMNELMESFNRGWASLTRGEPLGLGSLPLLSAKAGYVPRTDVADSGKSYDITVELPGMDEKDINVSVTGDRITVSGEKKSEREEKNEGYYLAERSYGSFQRIFPIPSDADADKIAASFDKGVLTVTIPKSATPKSKARKIGVKSG